MGRTIPSASVAGRTREAPRRWWDPSRRLLRSIRRYQATQDAQRGLFAGIMRRYWGARHFAQQPDWRGLLLSHPDGVVVHPGSEIGVNRLLFQQVTITKGVAIGGHVDIGAGARILGPVTIGDHARIGANAVVTRDVPTQAVAIGIPAQIRGAVFEGGR